MIKKSSFAKFAAGFVALATILTASSASAAYNFTTTLKQGSRGSAVMELQKALNMCADTQVAASGVGSMGMETSTFGPATKAAVMKFQAKHGITPVAGLFGPLTRAKMNATGCGTTVSTTLPAGCTSTVGFSPITGASCATGTVAPQTGSVIASLATTNPASATLVAGSAAANLAEFTFSNGTSSEVKVGNVQLMRTGVSIDSTLSNVYLYNGVNRLTDSATVSSGIITFNDPSGLFTVPANSTRTISVKADIASGVSGQTVGVTLTSFMTVGSTSATTVSLAGNIHATATVSGAATLDFNSTTTPSASSVDPQTDYTMWQNVVTVGNRDAWLKSFKLRQIGSVTNSDLQNFRLYVDGMMVGSAIPTLDSAGYITFDLSASPVKLMTGSRTIKVLGDIVGGSSRTFSFSLRQAADAWVTDSQLGTNILATANSSAFSARTSTSATINSGSLIISRQTNSPSGDTVNGAPGVVLARFDVKAFGEAMKIENLSFRIDEGNTVTTGDDDNSGANGMYTLRNGAVYLDGQQIGSTAAIAGDGDTTQAYTNFTFGSAAVIYPGTTRVLEVRADIYDNDTTNDIDATDTIQAEIVTGSSNVQRMSSLTYGSYPSAAVEGNTLTVATGSLTVAKDTSYGDQTTTVPKTAYLIGKYNIQANTTEGANITSMVVDFDEVADVFDASDDLTNLWLKINGSTTGAGGIKSTVSDTANTFSTNVNINPGQTMSVEVYADVASTAQDGGTADTGESSLTVSYTTTGGSSTSTSASEVDGQTITFSSGSFTTSVDGSSPFARIVAGNQQVVGAAYKFQAVSETYTIKELKVKVGSAAIASTINSVQFFDGNTAVGSAASFVQDTNTAALVTGLNIVVPAGTSKIITAKLMLNNIGTGAGTSQSNAALTLDSAKYADSQGVETTDGTDRAGNAMYVFKSVPTVTKLNANLSNAVNNSATDLYKFTVAASAQGDVAVKQFKLATTWSDPGTDSTLAITNIKLLEDGSDVTASTVSIVDEDGDNVESSGFVEASDTLIVSWDAGYESVVAAGTTKTYTVRGTLSGFVAQPGVESNSVTFAFNGDSSANGTSMYLNDETDLAAGQSEIWELFTSAAANSSDGTAMKFIWSDMASSAHTSAGNASSTGDWANGYKVLNFDLDTETFSTAL